MSQVARATNRTIRSVFRVPIIGSAIGHFDRFSEIYSRANTATRTTGAAFSAPAGDILRIKTTWLFTSSSCGVVHAQSPTQRSVLKGLQGSHSLATQLPAAGVQTSNLARTGELAPPPHSFRSLSVAMWAAGESPPAAAPHIAAVALSLHRQQQAKSRARPATPPRSD